jgi:hypothetical protein
MKSLTLLFCLVSSFCVAQPTIHLGADIAFDGDHRVSQAITYPDGTYGNAVFWSSIIRINPVEQNGFFNWYVFDQFAPVEEGGSVPVPSSCSVLTWYPVDHFHSPLPVGYDSPPQQWITNLFAFAYVPGQRDNYNLVFSTGITPYQSGDVWLDWTRNGRIRVTWSQKQPKHFGAFRHDGTLIQ